MMKKDELKNIVFITIAIAALISLAYTYILKNEITLSNVGRAVSFGVTATTVFWTFYFAEGWKWNFTNWLFYRPNINGTWSGSLISDYITEDGNNVPPIEFFIVVRQSFIRIHFTTFTKDFVGISYAETFSLDKDKGIKNVAYMYKKDTTQSVDKFLQEGATELRLILSKSEKRLEGKYWSNTKTQGTINVKFINKIHVDSFTDASNIVKNGK